MLRVAREVCARLSRASPSLYDIYRGFFVANIKSQIKRNKQNEKRRMRNKAVKSELKTAIRAVNTAVESTDKDAAAAALLSASRKLDKAVSKGVLHKNNAANRKSAISKKVNAL